MTNKNDNSNSKYRNFYVLGDSLSDNGAIIGILNNLSFAKSVKFDDPFYQGRSFSNGPTAVEYIAKYLDLDEFKPGWSYSFLGDATNSKVRITQFHMQQHLKFLTLFFLFLQ